MVWAKSELEVKKGKCFVCNLKCDRDAYVHYECAVAYSDEMNKRIKAIEESLEKKKK